MLKDPDWSKSVYLNYFEIHFFILKHQPNKYFYFFQINVEKIWKKFSAMGESNFNNI